jgi:hypothetical protein
LRTDAFKITDDVIKTVVWREKFMGKEEDGGLVSN